MRVLVVDDEGHARARLIRLLQDIEPCTVVGEAETGMQAITQTQQLKPELVLMDIRMPGMDGLDAARKLNEFDHPPWVIFTTAYDEHALAAFESKAIDYLLKPVRAARLRDAIERILQLRSDEGSVDPPQAGRTHLCVTARGQLQRIPIASIRYLKADQKYITVRHAQGEVLVEDALKHLEQEFADQFIRVHRNALVAQRYVAGVKKNAQGQTFVHFLDIDDEVEVSRRHLSTIKQWIKGHL